LLPDWSAGDEVDLNHGCFRRIDDSEVVGLRCQRYGDVAQYRLILASNPERLAQLPPIDGVEEVLGDDCSAAACVLATARRAVLGGRSTVILPQTPCPPVVTPAVGAFSKPNTAHGAQHARRNLWSL